MRGSTRSRRRTSAGGWCSLEPRETSGAAGVPARHAKGQHLGGAGRRLHRADRIQVSAAASRAGHRPHPERALRGSRRRGDRSGGSLRTRGRREPRGAPARQHASPHRGHTRLPAQARHAEDPGGVRSPQLHRIQLCSGDRVGLRRPARRDKGQGVGGQGVGDLSLEQRACDAGRHHCGTGAQGAGFENRFQAPSLRSRAQGRQPLRRLRGAPRSGETASRSQDDHFPRQIRAAWK
jgi:hypothetical protein